VRREASGPELADHTFRNATDLLADRVHTAPDHVAFGLRTDEGLLDVSTRGFDAACRDLAKGLIAQGLQPGDRVAVMAPTRYAWALADLATWLAGGVVVPVYETSSPDQVAATLAGTTPVLALAGGPEHRDALTDAGAASVWTMDAGARDLAALVASGREVPDAEVERRRRLAGPDDLATIVHTSGTTARQKAAHITHGNLVGVVQAVRQAWPEVVHEDAVTIIALPLAHILARGLQLAALGAGMKVVHEGDRTRVVGAFAQVRPTFMVVVPQLLEKIRQAGRDRANDARLGPVFRAAETTAVAWGRHLEAAQHDPAARPTRRLALAHAFFDRLFFRRLRRLMGDRVEWLLSGAAPLDPTLAHFFRGIGVPVIEGYGLTETTAPATGLRPGDLRAGSVGTPIPGTTIRIADDGEVLVRGVGVTPGYEDARDGEDAFVDGFFRTGDLGSLDEAGRLRIHGRRKNLIVTASGKNVAPEPWEAAVTRSPLVAHAVLVGEARSHLTAVLLLDPDAVRRWAERSGNPDVLPLLAGDPPPGGRRLDHPALLARLQRPVDRANAAVSPAEQARAFVALVADTTASSPFVTPTLKLQRDAFLSAASTHIETLYTTRRTP